jgi:hypothetical protein
VERVFKGVTQIHALVLTHAENHTNEFVQEKLRTEGFTFDILDASNGDIQLVEVNPFGAMSGCGPSLFHWTRDARVIYGVEEDAEISIAIVT